MAWSNEDGLEGSAAKELIHNEKRGAGILQGRIIKQLPKIHSGRGNLIIVELL